MQIYPLDGDSNKVLQSMSHYNNKVSDYDVQL